MRQEHELKISRRFKAPRERVFDAFLDRDALIAWWGPKGMSCPDPKIDPKVGGAYEFSILNDKGEAYVAAGVDLHQTLMPSEESASMHNQGWTSSFDKLGAFLAG